MGARAAAATLVPFWETAVGGGIRGGAGAAPGLFGKAFRAADVMADAETAAMLLRPFRIESLTDGHVNSLGKIADGYGQLWMAELLRTWFDGHQSGWAYGGARERPQWARIVAA